MITNTLILKGLTFSVALLFLGLACMPSIATTPESEQVEFTIELQGTGGLKKQNVLLTDRETAALEQLFEEIDISLKSAETREEVVAIFNTAIEALNEFGVLPQGMSVEQVQWLITGRFEKSHKYDTLPRDYREIHRNTDWYNLFCLVEASSEDTARGNIFSWIGIYWVLYFAFYKLPLLTLLGLMLLIYGSIKPCSIINRIIFMGETQLFSYGLMGKKDETIPPPPLALNGFTGIVITEEFTLAGQRSKAFYLGHCLVIAPFETDPW